MIELIERGDFLLYVMASLHGTLYAC